MKKAILFLMMIWVALTLLACSAPEPEPTPIPIPTLTPEPTSEPTSEPTPAPTPTPDPTPDPGPRSATTGLPYDGEYLPVVVVIENSSAGRPQRGLQMADVVYEVPVEGSITRFVCVFSDNIPEEVLPVRSARIPFLYIRHEWDALFMHYGGAGSAPSLHNKPFSVYSHHLYDDIAIDVDGIKGKWDDYFYRTPDRSKTHDVVGKVQLAQELYDYQPEPLAWQFAEDAQAEGEAADSVGIAFCTGDDDFVTYTYDAQSDTYLRAMSGKPFMAVETDAQVSVKNVIIQYSTYEGTKGYKHWKLTGSGTAEYYIGGTKVMGTWSRDSDDDPTVFEDEDGNQIVLRPGNTWIHICPEE